MAATTSTRPGWLLLVYRVPSKPSRNRVAAWRDMKRLGALYLQNCVCILPARSEVRAQLETAIAKIEAGGGATTLFEIPRMRPAEEAEIVRGFRAQSRAEYEEIIEECVTKFEREIEFERFRENYTFEESEEIAQDLDKIRRWFDRVVARDWFGGGLRSKTRQHLQRCERLLEKFEETVYERSGASEMREGRRPTVAPSKRTRKRPMQKGS